MYEITKKKSYTDDLIFNHLVLAEFGGLQGSHVTDMLGPRHTHTNT